MKKGKRIDGSEPLAGLIMDKTGRLYGTTVSGGAYRFGAVFEVTLNAARTESTETVLYSFCADATVNTCLDGMHPEAGLITDRSGALYGTTSAGGVQGEGTAFELIADAARTEWTETVLHSFCSRQGSSSCTDGDEPEAGLIRDGSGNLYGTTYSGGAFDYGTVFELMP